MSVHDNMPEKDSAPFVSAPENADRLPGGFFISRFSGEPLYANKKLIDTFECDSFEDFCYLIKGNIMNMVYSRDRSRVESDMWMQMQTGNNHYSHLSYRICTKTGRIRYLEEFGTVIDDAEKGRLIYGFTVDSDMKYLTYELNKLTKLPGMNRFIEFAGRMLEINQKNTSAPQFAFVFFNIRNFKMINVKFGIEAGNEFLKRTAEIVRTVFPDDYISHLADDHFAVLTDTAGLEERIAAVHDKLEEENRYASVEIKAGVYKVTGYPCDAAMAVDLAKLACDSIRTSVSDFYRIYTPSLSSDFEISRFAARNLDRAIQNGDIRVFYQPVIRTISGKVCGMEALARWYSPETGMISPGLFISALEENRQIYKLDCFMIESICRDYREITDKGGKTVPVSFNLSRFDFLLCDIFDVVETAVNKYRVPRDMLHIEITESMVVSDGGRIKETIDRLHKAGYLIWMDDFGSGYSSLGVLKDYEFDELKIDMAFLRNMNAKARSIVTSVVSMSKGIGVNTLAEGVETQEQFDFLRDIGCEKVQGYLFGKPAPYDDCMKNLSERGIELETPEEGLYYRSAGLIDFLTDKPLAIIESSEAGKKLLYANKHYFREMAQVGITDYDSADTALNREWIENFTSKVEHSSKPEVLRFFENGARFRLTAQAISRLGGRTIIKGEIINITKDKITSYEAHMDDRLRAVYRQFSAVYLVKLSDKTAELIYMPGGSEIIVKNVGNDFRQNCRMFCDNWITEEYRERFDAFNDLDTLADRIAASPHGSVSERFVTRFADFDTAIVCSFSAVPGSDDPEYILTIRPADN